MKKSRKKTIEVEALTHADARRRNIPTAEFESLMREEDKSPVQIAYARRNRDLDPQLVWRGKDEQDWSDLIVQAPPLYIQEKVHPKVLIDDLRRQSKERAKEKAPPVMDLFGDFNGLHDMEAKTEFYAHDQNWSNRMILGDSLSVMASLAEREGLRGQVQCIYIDPPYGIRFNSNFQWSTTSTIVKDGNKDHITREPEQVRAFRDTWRDGIHSYLTYLRDRFTVARDLLHESGSIFVQIGDENVHRVRALMDEIFGEENFISQISFRTKIPLNPIYVGNLVDHLVFYAKAKEKLKFRRTFIKREIEGSTFSYVSFEDGRVISAANYDESGSGGKRFTSLDFMASGYTQSCHFNFEFHGKEFSPRGTNSWKTTPLGVERVMKADRLVTFGTVPRLKQYFDDYPVMEVPNFWSDTQGASGKAYVVQTASKVVERCILMASDPGDIVLDPTCGSGTTAFVAEQWGRRWITIDTSRVALALARARVMGARYPYYLLADSPEGQMKEAEVTRSAPHTTQTHLNVRLGFVYERVPHITLGSISSNAEIDVIWDKWQETLEPLRASLNKALSKSWEEWEIPREADDKWPAATRDTHTKWWGARISRQKEIDTSIAAKAEFEYLYDKPYTDNSRVRVAGPFTVESLSPHRVLAVDADDSLIDGLAEPARRYRHDGSGTPEDFADMILENLKAAGVQQAHKEDRIVFTALTGWPGRFICAEGRFMEGEQEAGSAAGATGTKGREKRAGILIGPEFGTVSRPNLVAAAREAGDAGFDVLILRLTAQEQKAVKTTAFDLQLNPASPSMKFHRIGRAKDPHLWSLRVNADIRMIVHKSAASLLLVYVDHHDDAYKWAERRKIERHPTTGAMQLVEIRERVEEIAAVPPVAVASEPVVAPTLANPKLFENLRKFELMAFGVPEEWVDSVRGADEGSLLDVIAHLPAEAQEAILRLAVGETPEPPKPLPVEADPFTHPDAQRRFRVLTNVEELKRALEYPWEKWVVFLHPDQRRFVDRTYSGPARISGSAGTGKTIVALHRAVHLARENAGARVLLTTFSKALANALKVKLNQLVGNEPVIAERITVQSITGVGYDLYAALFGQPNVAAPALIQSLLAQAAGNIDGHKFSSPVLFGEWTEVVDAWQLKTWEAYRDVSRLGRKTRIGGKQRESLWSIFELVRAGLIERSVVTWPDIFGRLAEHLTQSSKHPFDFAVVDEAQDIGVAEARFLGVLASGRPEGLFFTGDLGQRIFQQPFSWKSLGIDVRGRSHTLRINYRTSHQIRSQADRLLPPTISDVDGNVESRRGTISVFNGPLPEIRIFESANEEGQAVGHWITDRLKDGCLPHEIGVFVRANGQLKRARAAVKTAGAQCVELSEKIDAEISKVAVSTMHLAKGLEFRAVAVMACDDEVIPSQDRIETVADESDLEEIYNTERHLLYVACTRARDHLLVSGVEPASEFLDDLAT